jgi:Rab GDP dissociation inhibitor
LQFKQIQGSYVYREGKINKVPVTAMEALNSNLMGFFEKRRAKKFLEFVEGVKEKEQASWQGLHIFQMNVKLMFDYFGLEPGTRDFVGHALALYLDEHYVTLPAWDCIERIQLYTSSLLRFGKSPYVYPLYGLGELPQSFARRSATYGGLFMLDTPITVNFTENKVSSVQTKEGLVNCKTVISDPSYFNDQVAPAGKVVRAICFLNHTIPDTDNSDSVQIILPQNQVNRKNDM